MRSVGLIWLGCLGLIMASVACKSTCSQEAATTGNINEVDYFAVDADLLTTTFDESQIVSREALPKNAWYQMDTMERIVVDRGSEAFLLRPQPATNAYEGVRIVGVKPKGATIHGNLYALQRSLQDNQKSVLVKFPFDVPAKPTNICTREDFQSAKGDYFVHLWSEQHAGSAIWRHLATSSLATVGRQAVNTGPKWPLNPNDGLDATIQLMSGGRAVSENLQLDRQLPIHDSAASDTTERVELAKIPGITLAAVNWQQRIAGIQIELDPLATLVPHDQYALFLPNFGTFARMIEDGQGLARPLVQWFEPQSRSTDSFAFYQQQMGLSLNFASRQLGSVLVSELAITGSDPYFRTGTDVALLMRSEQLDVLYEAIVTQSAVSAKQFAHSQQTETSFEGVKISHWQTKDRHFSCNIAKLPGTVVVSNSTHQLHQVILASLNKYSRMHDADEYKFFRYRYPRQTKSDKALLVVTDAAIRRWCGPQWRISASQRTRARANIAELTAQNFDALARGNVQKEEAIVANAALADMGATTLSPRGIHSERYGTLEFQTPIAELDLQYASLAEVSLYENWRRRYQSRWQNVFDPIAIEIEFKQHAISADLSVIPLILGTDYRWIQNTIGNVRLKNEFMPDYPEAIVTTATALDTNSQSFNFLRGLMGNSNIDLFSWIDGAAIGFIDYDEAWFERQSQVSPWILNYDHRLQDLPAAGFLPSRDNVKMAAFVLAMRATLERLVPNIISWTEADHAGTTYAVGTFKSNLLGDGTPHPHIYYTTLRQGFLVSTNERVLKRAIDRFNALEPSVAEKEPQPVVGEARLAPQYTLRMTGQGANFTAWSGWNNGMRRMSRIAWSNLPVLNYLRSRYPDRDPAKLYEAIFGELIEEPAGGTYEWNDNTQTYESTLYGHHLAPQAGPGIAPVLTPADKLQTSLSFQDGGLRVEMKLMRQQ